MLITVNYVKTIDNRMKIYNLYSDEECDNIGYVCSYKSQDSDLHFNCFFIVNGDLSGLYRYSEDETLEVCLEKLQCDISFFYEDVELIYNGETIKDECPDDNIDSSILERLPFEQK